MTLWLSDVPPAPPGIGWWFTQRHGGVSEGGYASLNLGGHVGDDPDRVASNRARLLAALGAPLQRLRLLEQVHGVRVVTWHDDAPAQPPPSADGHVTRQRGLLLGILTADCAPLLLADAEAGVVGALHAGWRGAAAGMVRQGVAAMAALGARVERLHAVIGPCIRQSAYTVGDEVRDAFLRADPEAARWFSPAVERSKHQFDLPGQLLSQLRGMGIASDRLHLTPYCTHEADERFFSHRRASQTGQAPCGRQLAVIQLL